MTLRNLVNEGFILSAASNINTPVDLLAEFAKDSYSTNVRSAVAANPSTPEEILCNLANEGFAFYVARNKHAPADLLDELAQSIDSTVRRGVASNHNASVFALKLLVKDKYQHIRDAAYNNPNLPA